jgi:hypothetical protein
VVRQRLSQRIAGAEPDGPFEGVPAHLHHGLVHWWDGVVDTGPGGVFTNEGRIRELAAFLRIGVNQNLNAAELARGLLANAQRDEEFFLDLVDATLDIFRPPSHVVDALRRLLDVSGSVWTVTSDNQELVLVVSDEAQATFDAATSVADDINTEMKEAWGNAFGRNGDPSDAWDHAIKAMEALFIPLVIPNKAKPNLGGVIGELRNQGHVWKIVLPGKDQNHDVAPLVGMLDGIWPNVDRHAGSGTTRPPTAEEARAVVTLAATIVQWHRDSWVVQRR